MVSRPQLPPPVFFITRRVDDAYYWGVATSRRPLRVLRWRGPFASFGDAREAVRRADGRRWPWTDPRAAPAR